MTYTLGRFAKPAHNAVARMVADTLTLGDVDDFAGLSVVLRAKLTPYERQALASAALSACDDDEAAAVAGLVIPETAGAGWPMSPSVDDLEEEARFWADHTSPAELRAYASVCTERARAAA
jgi:hypothetical protein